MSKIIMYTTGYCPYCVAAKNVLASKGLVAEEIRIDTDPAKRDEMMTRSKQRTVPQIFIGDHHVGGHDDLVALDRSGGLQAVLEEQGVQASG